MLNTPGPFALIYATISPPHLSIAITLVLFIFAFISVATGPCEHSVALLLVVEIITLILITRLWTLGTLPTPFTMLKSLMELSYVKGSILPSILTSTIGFTIFILSRISVSVFE